MTLISSIGNLARGVGNDLKRIRLTRQGESGLVNTLGVLATDVINHRVPPGSLWEHLKRTAAEMGFNPKTGFNIVI